VHGCSEIIINNIHASLKRSWQVDRGSPHVASARVAPRLLPGQQRARKQLSTGHDDDDEYYVELENAISMILAMALRGIHSQERQDLHKVSIVVEVDLFFGIGFTGCSKHTYTRPAEAPLQCIENANNIDKPEGGL
jgi:hypothetical protein